MDTNPTSREQKDGIARFMNDRAALYGLLARAFRSEVDEAFWHDLRTMRYPQGSDDPAINDAFRQIYRYVRHAREDALDELSVDFARAFLGSGVLNPNAAFPYESVYTSTHALLMQDARDEVLALYRSQGIDKDPAWTDPEDHIALELAFMQALCERTAQAVEDADDPRAFELVKTQYGFLTNHLLRWAPRFFIDVARYATTGLYHGFAALAATHLDNDRALLEDIAQASGINLDVPTAAEPEPQGERHA